MNKTYRRSGGLAAVAAATVIGLAACGPSRTPHVPSLGKGSGSGSASPALPKRNPPQLLDEWAACMRSHGDPNQVDPTIDANKVIHITYPPGANDPGAGNGSNDPCGAYLTAASTGLGGGTQHKKPDPAKLQRFAVCMRANGVPDFPDPNSNQPINGGTDVSPSNPIFRSAAKVCDKKIGVPLFGGAPPPPGSIEASTSDGPQGGPGGNGGAGASRGVTAGG